ncbi:DUF2225 domain-containing protein [Haloimpatiens sp. FM7315]|uniref:DUF2225 domain-containing protein n=1 Tax=Haloimpatiens sp. FM7315 TaxID=3298609 RepID=UPI00370AF3B9
MNDNIFSGLEKLGFNDIINVDLYNDIKTKKEKSSDNSKKISKQGSYLYNKEIICPVCNTAFKAKAVKTSSYRVLSRDTDFFTRYAVINPYFYDIWLCNSCGYASMKVDFFKIKSYKINEIKTSITSKWKPREYPEVYDVDIAIERYKLALLNYYVIESVASKKAMACLKIAWMYRLKNDSKNELIFLGHALTGIEEAFFKEDFPIYGMDRYTTMYLIGELNHKLSNYDKALLWFSKVIVQPGVKYKIKELARDQREYIKLNYLSENKIESKENENEKSTKDHSISKKNFINKFFK